MKAAFFTAVAFFLAVYPVLSDAQEASSPETKTENKAQSSPDLNKEEPLKKEPQTEKKKLSPEEEKAEIEKRLSVLKKQMDANPKNLDAYFNYAKLATRIGKAKEAEDAYNHMLLVNPKLPRIKLELGLIYTATGRFKEAKPLFEAVLATNPPEKVKANINTVLDTVNKALRKDIISLSASIGINQDSNANSAASTGETTFNDVSIPLAASSQSQSDGHLFLSAAITHLHKFEVDSENWGASLTTNGTVYRTHQGSEQNLDLALASMKIGPTLDLKKLKTQVGFALNQSLINLNSFKYLKTRGIELTTKYAHLDNLIYDYSYTYEYRKFANAPASLTNVNRTGNAYQNKIGVTYALTQQDVFNATATWRNEEARNLEFGNDQINLTSSYTRQLPYDVALNVLAGFKKTHYNDVDPLVSTAKIRNDRERSVTFTFAKKLPKNLTATLGYQYKNSTSNLQNFDYVNHRFSGALGWTF